MLRLSAPDLSNVYEIYSTGGAKTVHITDWALDLREFNTYKFFGSGKGKLDFTGSRLILRPGAPEQGFAWDREYAVRDMVKNNGIPLGAGAVASVTTEFPELLEARLTERGTDLEKYKNQYISLHRRVNAATSPGRVIQFLEQRQEAKPAPDSPRIPPPPP